MISGSSGSSTDTRVSPWVEGFYDARTGSVQYIVTDPTTRRCAIIDPVLDFDEKSGTTATRAADTLLTYVRNHHLHVQWILETHPHADHLSAAGYLQAVTGAPTAIGERVVEIQERWRDLYNLPMLRSDGSQWDRLLVDGEYFYIGELRVHVMLTPGHTPASITYLIGDAAFIHDTLFMPDSGSARADFPGGNARALWTSIRRILALPDDTRLFTGHDYRPAGRPAAWESTVKVQKTENPHAQLEEDEFVSMRQARDRALPMPRLILSALQVNLNGGRLPPPEDNGRRYLKIPLDAFSGVPWD